MPMVVYTLTEEQRQIILLALVELARQRPGWGAAIREITDDIFSARLVREEIERLLGDLAVAYSSEHQRRLETVELGLANAQQAIAILEARDRIEADRATSLCPNAADSCDVPTSTEGAAS